MRILAADIGGTHSRFAVASMKANTLDLGPVFSMDTRQPGARSFARYWEAFCALAPKDLSETDSFDAISLAVAGSVYGRSAVLPNIDWDISEGDIPSTSKLFLLNDFVAQGYALTSESAIACLELVRSGNGCDAGCIALVGAGTGLGHCALYQQRDGGFLVAGSEAGHAAFAFQGEREKAIERQWLEESGKPWLSNDDVVSGPGVVRLHACLRGESLTPAEALADASGETATFFSRFYARACRNYCLSVFPVRCLVLSGGVAIGNRHLVRSAEFLKSFDDGGDYSHRLARIPIRLNTDPHAGIRGAAIYAAKRLRTTTRKPNT